MNLILYNNSSDDRTVNKSLVTVIALENVKPVEPFNIQTAKFIIDKNNININTVNYCYCAETQRYYYINDITLLTGGRVQIDCRVDVLMSYKSNILNLKALCLRNEIKRNPYLKDNETPVTVRTKQRVIEFSENPFYITDVTPSTSNCFILCVAGNEGET